MLWKTKCKFSPEESEYTRYMQLGLIKGNAKRFYSLLFSASCRLAKFPIMIILGSASMKIPKNH